MNSIVVHYQELALKGKNRPWFLGRLVRNLRRALSDLDVRAVRALMGRIEVVLGPDASRDAVGERISRVFGIANFSYAGRTAIDNGRSEAPPLALRASASLAEAEGEGGKHLAYRAPVAVTFAGTGRMTYGLYVLVLVTVRSMVVVVPRFCTIRLGNRTSLR